jgi:hypothetical protein
MRFIHAPRLATSIHAVRHGETLVGYIFEDAPYLRPTAQMRPIVAQTAHTLHARTTHALDAVLTQWYAFIYQVIAILIKSD